MIEVTAAIIERDGMVLAARRKAGKHLAGFWEFPGGKVEEGESKEECLRREIQEELGVEIAVSGYVGQSTYDYGEKIVRLHAFRADYVTGDFSLNDHDEILWLSDSQLDELDWAPADVPLISQYRTHRFYRLSADSYATETRDLPVNEGAEKFIDYIRASGKLLDLGCGAGRDSEFFARHGFQVIAADSSVDFIARLQDRKDFEAVCCSYFDLPWNAEFDAIWANASLLHCPKFELPSVLMQIGLALVPGGYFYASFKHGSDEHVDGFGRLISRFTEAEIRETFTPVSGLSEVEIWSSRSELRGQEQDWLNVILRRDNS